MKVVVKWNKSPRRIYHIPRAAGTTSVVDEAVAKEILKVDPKFLEILETLEPIEKEKPIEVKDTMVKQTRTRPVKREKKS